MKKVEIFEYGKVTDPKGMDISFPVSWEKKKVEEGLFLEFGVDYEEFESGPGNFSIALVLMDDGNVKSVPVNLIKFNGE